MGCSQSKSAAVVEGDPTSTTVRVADSRQQHDSTVTLPEGPKIDCSSNTFLAENDNIKQDKDVLAMEEIIIIVNGTAVVVPSNDDTIAEPEAVSAVVEEEINATSHVETEVNEERGIAKKHGDEKIDSSPAAAPPAAEDEEVVSISNMQKMKMKPNFKHHHQDATTITTNMDELMLIPANNSMYAKSLVLGVNDKTVRSGVLVLEDNVTNEANKNVTNKRYGAPFDFDLPVIVADMETRERDRRQIILKRGVPAIKINEYVRVVVVSIVVEPVSSSYGSSYYSSQW